MGRHSVVFSYDADGRQTQRRRQTMGGDDVVGITCNEHGDPAVEVTRSTRFEGDVEQGAGMMAVYSEARHSYQYDSYGNWTEQETSYRNTPDGAFIPSTAVRHTLTYY